MGDPKKIPAVRFGGGVRHEGREWQFLVLAEGWPVVGAVSRCAEAMAQKTVNKLRLWSAEQARRRLLILCF